MQIKAIAVEIVAYTLIAVALIVACILLIRPLPRVMWSYSKDECVEVRYVVNGEEVIGSCDKLPEKFDKIWVK